MAIGYDIADAQDVRFHFEIRSVSTPFEVESVSIVEALNEIPGATLDVVALTEPPELRELLSKQCQLLVERGEEIRYFRGIVYTASRESDGERVSLSLQIIPALGVLRENRDSRIFQNQTVPKIIREILDARGRGTQLDDQTEREYHPHEYVVQYGESDWAFISRLMQEEGICCTFDHAKDDPLLVIFDKAGNRPSVRASSNGQVPFMQPGRFNAGHEVVTHASYHEQVGPTELELRDYDWTNPGLKLRARRESDTGHLQSLHVYDPHFPQRAHSYRGEQYTAHTLEAQADLLAERLETRRQSWSMQATVVSAQPGHWLELTGHPEALDGRYLILSVHGGGTATAGETGSYAQSLSVVPLDLPYRPARTIAPPVALPVTARVVGPAGEEIHTDEHGRLKVQFHWDREGRNDEHASCWLRVAQTWAGAGWGAWTLPRIGMEVLVTFLEGDPDRPLVTGCVYNGDNRTPYPLPKHRTRSTLKSNSSPGGDGFNELRFEDKKGDEEIWIHAQKDFNEKVLHDHNTKVDHCQTNVVDVDQSEHIGHDQTLVVDNHRAKTVKRDEVTEIGRDRTETVLHDEKVTVVHDRSHRVQHDDVLLVDNAQQTRIAHGQDFSVKADGRKTYINPDDTTTVTSKSSTDVGMQWKVTCQGTVLWLDKKVIEGATSTKVAFDVDKGAAKLALKGGGGSAIIECDQSIVLKVGDSVIRITSSEIHISSPLVKIDGSNNVLINC